MLDTSMSTSGVLGDIKKAAKDFLKELRPQDRAMIVTFDWQFQKLSTLTNDRKELENAIRHAKVGKHLGTVLNDALMDVSTHVLQPIRGRKAIILLSDGRRTTGPDPLDAARMAADRGVRVYTVGFGTEQGGAIGYEGWSVYVRLDEETLKQVAEVTRAEYFYAGTSEDLKKVYQRLTTQFVLEKKDTEIAFLFAGVATLLLTASLVLSLLWFSRV